MDGLFLNSRQHWWERVKGALKSQNTIYHYKYYVKQNVLKKKKNNFVGL